MKLEFYDLNELDAFLAWAGRGRIGSAIVIGADPKPMTGEVLGSVGTTGELHGFAGRMPMENGPDRLLTSGEVNAPVTGEPGPEMASAPAPAARKRRTKAEIEAENTAKAGQAAAQPQLTAQEAIAQALASAAAGNAPGALTAESVQAATIPDMPEALSPTDPKLLPHEFIQQRAAEIGELAAIEHLNAARNFIAKHGMPKYNESFQLCGLHANVMAFAPAECATHAAALEWLDKA